MFGQTMPTIQLLERAQRDRGDYATQATVATVCQDPAPQPSAASGGNHADPAQQNSAPDSDSESSQSLSSTDESEGMTTPPSPPSHPFYMGQVVKETAPILSFSKACVTENGSEKHCTLHCDYLLCKRRVYLNIISHACQCKPLSSPSAKISLEALDMLTAKEIYADARKDDHIVVFYPAALEILERFVKRGYIDLWHFLLGSPAYTKSTIHTPTRHATAAKSAHGFISSGMEEALHSACTLSDNQTRVILIHELEASFEETLRLDCVAWAQKWVYRGEGEITWNWFTSEMRESKGLQVLVKEARECVRDLVGALIWWDLQRREVEEVEQARRKAFMSVLDHMAAETE